MSDTKISKKQALINKIKKDKLITKGLSKLSMKELKDFYENGLHASDWLGTLDDKTAYEKRQKILTLMTRKKLLKIISATRIKNYSHLTHKDLINLIADKYWGDFHDKWQKVARDDKTLLPDWYYGGDKIRKIGRTKKVKKEEEAKPQKTKKPKPKKPKVEPKKKEEKKEEPEPEEKKDDEAPKNTPMTTAEGNKKLKEILSSKAMPKSKLRTLLTDLFSSMKGNPNFYKKNKEIIDKLTSPEFRKRMDFN